MIYITHCVFGNVDFMSLSVFKYMETPKKTVREVLELVKNPWCLMIWVCQIRLNKDVSMLRFPVRVGFRIADSFALYLSMQFAYCWRIGQQGLLPQMLSGIFSPRIN